MSDVLAGVGSGRVPRLFVLAVLAGGMVALCSADGAAEEKAATQIGVSESGHFVTYEGKPLLLIGDSGTQCVAQNSALDHRAWLDDCAAAGIRAVHLWSFVAVRQKQDGSQVEDRWGYVIPDVTPWVRKAGGPTALDQRPQWDLQRFDEGEEGDFSHYWPRLRDLCAYAKSKGMLVGITMFTGWSKHDYSWVFHPLNRANGGHLTGNKDAVTIETPGSEVWQEDYAESWPDAKKTQWVWEQFSAKMINDVGALGNVFFVFFDEHSYGEGNMGDHFAAFFRKRGMPWMDWGQRRDRVDFVYDQRLMAEQDNDRLKAQFHEMPVRPYFGLEEGGGSHNYTTAVLEMVWRYSLGGGNFIHHDDERQETVTTGVMVYDPNSIPPGEKDKVRERLRWLGNASRFFNEHIADLDGMAPHDELAGPDTYCMANPGKEYVVYVGADSPERITVDLSADAGKDITYRFYNPRRGRFHGEHHRTGGRGDAPFDRPDEKEWVLHIVCEAPAGDGAR